MPKRYFNPGTGLEGRSVWKRPRHEFCAHPIKLIIRDYNLIKISRVFKHHRSIIAECHFQETPISFYLEHYDVWYLKGAKTAYQELFLSLSRVERLQLKEGPMGDMFRAAFHADSELNCDSESESSSSSSSSDEDSESSDEPDKSMHSSSPPQSSTPRRNSSEEVEREGCQRSQNCSDESVIIEAELPSPCPPSTTKYFDSRVEQSSSSSSFDDSFLFRDGFHVRKVKQVSQQNEDILIHFYVEELRSPFCFHHDNYLNLPNASSKLYEYFLNATEQEKKMFEKTKISNLYMNL